MAQDNGQHWLKFDYFILLLLLVLAFYVAFIPHSGYHYPVHLDEWLRMAGSRQIASNATAVGLMNPVSGEPFSDGRDYEVGYHLFWAVFHQVSGLPWIVIFRYFPGVILIFTVLAVYILARRQGFGWEAAFFTCLIPTTVGILGPAFMVPMAMALLFIPLTLFLVFNIRTVWTYVVLVIFMAFLVTIHGPTAVVLVIIVAPFLLISLKGDFKHSAAVILALAAPFIISLPWTWHLIVHNGAAIFTQHDLKAYVDYPRLARIYGYPIIVLCLGGTFLLAMRGGRREYGLVLGLTSILIVLAIFYSTNYGIPVLYERGLIPMMLMAGIAAGACLVALRKLELPVAVTSRLKISPTVIGYIGWALCLAAVVVTLVTCIPLRQSTPYYHCL
jgi:hypothetical protein